MAYLLSKRLGWGAGFLCAMCCASAVTRAGFSISYLLQQGAPDASHDRYQFFALNDGLNGTGTTILGEDIQLICDKPMVVGANGVGGADFFGQAAPDPYNSDRSFINILGTPGTGTGPASGTVQGFPVPSATDTSTWIGGTTSMEVAMFHIVTTVNGVNHGPDATTASNNGLGALIATMVVPSDASFVEMIPWGLGGEKGPAYGYFLGGTNPDSLHPFDPTKQYVMSATVAAPEPGSFGVAVLTLMVLGYRRRLPV